MQEQLITFETAKLAKEKGFNNYTESQYMDRAVEISAPTQSLLQKWLREIHKIECYVIPYKDHSSDNNDPLEYKALINGLSFSMYNSYESALEIGLQKALKLIEI